MSISEQAKTQIMRLVYEGQRLDPLDLDEVDRWVRASYEALGFNPLHQAKFGEYCCSPWGPTSMRVQLGVWMLKQPLLGADGALDEDITWKGQCHGNTGDSRVDRNSWAAWCSIAGRHSLFHVCEQSRNGSDLWLFLLPASPIDIGLGG